MANWLNEDEMRAWIAFLRAASLVNRSVEDQLKADAGLSHLQYEILVHLASSEEGERRMGDLAKVLLNSKSGLNYQVNQMEKQGLVERRTCPSDSRSIFARITKKGLRKLEESAPGHVDRVREALIDVLTPDEQRTLTAALERVYERLRS
ncbi:MarR family winged helix-turn-helix transcriptional regulator [Salininema proteolyticum]|uniref:MarR family winged helix-turn-helix transcriptional regulator n=1 Tax=Salininema proteolyticum TaxID=1607685 RepID=A0ABV8U1K1_9ACTN